MVFHTHLFSRPTFNVSNQGLQRKCILLVHNCEPCKFRAIPRNSAQFRAIPRNSLTVTRNQRNRIPIGLTIVSINRFSLSLLFFPPYILIKTFYSFTYITRSIILYCISLGNPVFFVTLVIFYLVFICYKIKKNFSIQLVIFVQHLSLRLRKHDCLID